MAATRGPVPKRSEERRRRNKGEAIDKVSMEGSVTAPPADETWHPIARSWYESLSSSGQSQYFEPSDWQAARYVAQAMTQNLTATKFSAVMFAAVWSAMSDLLTTEGERRRVRLEIERGPVEEEAPAGVTAIGDYRKRVGG